MFMLDDTFLDDPTHRLHRSSHWSHTQALCIEDGTKVMGEFMFALRHRLVMVVELKDDEYQCQ